MGKEVRAMSTSPTTGGGNTSQRKGKRHNSLSKCQHCGITFQPWRVDSPYCSRSCSNAANGLIQINSSTMVCACCLKPLPRLSFSRSDKTDRARPNPACRDCSKRMQEEAKQKRVWYHRKVASILCNCRTRARAMGVEFTLTREDIIIPERCPVFGVTFEDECSKKGRYFAHSFSPSIDRIDNARGYTKDNIVIVSCRANSIKGDATLEELREVLTFYENLQ